MDKVYLLLRNNQETGPYSLEEILQTGLKPNDLVWVEGKSCSWLNPSELEALKPYVLQTNPSATKTVNEESAASQTLTNTVLPSTLSTTPATSKYVYVSFPANFIQKASIIPELSPAESLEQKAEELGKRIQAYSPEHKTAEAVELNQPVYYHTLNDLEKEYAAWKQAQKKAKKIKFLKRIGITALIVLLLGAGYVLAKQAIYTKGNKTEAIGIKTNGSLKKTVLSEIKEPEPIPEETVGNADSLSASNDSSLKITNEKPLQITKKKSPPSISLPPKVHLAVPIMAEAEKGLPMPMLIDSATATKEDNSIPLAPKKKTLGEKIGRLFKPKHKRDNDEPGKAPGTTETFNLSNWVDISYTSSFNPVKGVQDLNFMLSNRSNEVLKTATVEVRYYSAKNNFLEKKILTFTNVPPQKSTTITVSSSKLADHTYYHLLSVTD